MNKRIWNLYEHAMRGDRKVYQFMYDRIPRVIRGKEVLELATGPGLLAKHVAHAAKRMVATDYAEGMIREAQKGPCPANLTFEVADATALPYPDASFDVVLIANALHIMPDPEQALREIRRVLRLGGPVPKGHARHTGIHGRHDRGRHLGQPERSIFLPPSGGFYFLWYPQSQYGPPDASVYCRMNSLPPPASFMVWSRWQSAGVRS